jgi:hypothetical protein
MTLPANLSTCHITCTYLATDGTPLAGVVSFTPSPTFFLDPETNTYFAPKPIVGTLTDIGLLDVTVPASDDPDTSPNGFTYIVSESLNSGDEYIYNHSYSIKAPSGAELDLAAVVPVENFFGEPITRGPAGPAGIPGPPGSPGTPTPPNPTPDGNVAVSITTGGTPTANYVDPGQSPYGPGAVAVAMGYLSTPGVNGSYAVAAGACSLTGDIDIRWFGSPLTIAGGSFKTMLNAVGGFDFRQLSSNGKPSLWVSPDGSSANSASYNPGTATIPANVMGWRATWRHADGQTKIFALDPAGSVVTGDGKKWTQIGTTGTAAISGTFMLAGAKAVGVGGLSPNGTEAAALITTRTEIYDGIDLGAGATLVVGTQFSGHELNDLSFTDETSKLWNIYGTAYLLPKSGTVTKSGTQLVLGTPGNIQAATGGRGWKRINPVSHKYKPEDFGDLDASPESCRAAIDAACVVASTYGGGTIEFGSRTYTVGPNPAVLNPVSGLPYASLLTYQNVHFQGGGPASIIKQAANANCHLFGHSGVLQGSGQQDHIDNVWWSGLTLDGSRTTQDGARDHDGLHIPQHPGLKVDSVRIINCDGDAYFSTALGEFHAVGVNPGTNIVRPIWLTDVYSYNNAGWGFFMSATNRNTHYQGLHAENNGSPQAQICGNSVAVTLTATGHLDLLIDSFTVVAVPLTAGMTPAQVVTAINDNTTGVGGKATASLTPQGRLIIRSNTVGGLSRVYLSNTTSGSGTTTTAPLSNLGLTTSPKNGDLNYRVGANQCGGFFLDHSQCHVDGLMSVQNYGDGVYIHNVNNCQYSNIEATQNTGYGIYVEALVSGVCNNWTSAMNCTDYGHASYRDAPRERTVTDGVTQGSSAGRTITDGVLASTSTRTVTDGVLTADTLVTSATANFTSADIGSAVTGTGIRSGSVISVVNDPTSVNISQPATTSAIGVSITISRITTFTSATAVFVSGDVGSLVNATGIPANTIISSRTNATTVVLSQTAPAAGSAITALITPAYTVTSATAGFQTTDINDVVISTDVPVGTVIIAVAGGTAALLSQKPTTNTTGVTLKLTRTAEVYFDDLVVGYGITGITSLRGILAPGLKQTIGPQDDNRKANFSVLVENGITATFDGDDFDPVGLNVRNIAYGAGGLAGNLVTPATYVPSAAYDGGSL